MTMEKIQFSCADFTFPLLSHLNVLKLIQMMGFSAVDLGVFEGRSHLIPGEIAKNPEKEGKRLLQDLDFFGLNVADVFLQPGEAPSVAAVNTPLHSVKDRNRVLFMRMLDFTNTLGCRHMTGLPGVAHPGESSTNDWHRAVEETMWRFEKAKSAGITYAVEPHIGSILPDVESTVKFIKDCPGLGITLDYGHFIYVGLTNESVHPLINYATHFHARGGAKGKLQTIVKENTIDFRSIIHKFLESSYSGYICLEYVYQDWEGCNRTDNVSETILLYEHLKKQLTSVDPVSI